MREKKKEVLKKILIIIPIEPLIHFFISRLRGFFSKGSIEIMIAKSIIFTLILGIIIPTFQNISTSTPQ